MCVYLIIYLDIYLCVSVYISTIKKVVAFLIYANMNIMINEPDKGQNTIKLYIVIQPTFLFLSYFSSDC